MEKYIVEKYKSFDIKEIQSGYRCKTFLISCKDNKYIYQIYTGNTKYQASKKEYISNLIKKDIEINEIPNIIEYGEDEEFSYLVSQYKVGQELEKVLHNGDFKYNIFYDGLANILAKIHSVEVGNMFRLGRK